MVLQFTEEASEELVTHILNREVPKKGLDRTAKKDKLEASKREVEQRKKDIQGNCYYFRKFDICNGKLRDFRIYDAMQSSN